MLTGALWARRWLTLRWLNLFQRINELSTSLFYMGKNKHKGPGSTQSKANTTPNKKIPYLSTPFYSWASAPSSTFFHKYHIKQFILGYKMAGNSSKCELSQGNLYLGRNQSLKQKNQNSSIALQGLLGSKNVLLSHCLWNNSVRLPPITTYEADLHDELAFSFL